MFELGSSNADIGGCGLGVLQGVLSFYDRNLIRDSGFVLDLVVSERLFESNDGIVKKFL